MISDSKAGKRGRFITLEGSEGVGKTSNLQVIEEHLQNQGIDLVVTREPGGTALGERVRTLLLDPAADVEADVEADIEADVEEPPMADMAELLLMFAARAQHVTHVIEPALAAGKWVLSDRFTDASFAYQGGGRGVAMASIETLQTLVQGELRPDKTIYLDLDPAVAFERIAGRDHDRIEREQLDFFHRVRNCYLDRAASEPQRFAVIDAGAPLASVAVDVCAVLDEFLTTLRATS